MSEVDSGLYMQDAVPVEVRRTTNQIVTKEPLTQPRSVEPSQPVKPVATVVTPQKSQTVQELEAKLEAVGIGSKVYHKKFGNGTVVKINKNEKFIYIKFLIGEKKFQYPDAFFMRFLEI